MRAAEVSQSPVGETQPHPFAGCVLVAPDGRTLAGAWQRAQVGMRACSGPGTTLAQQGCGRLCNRADPMGNLTGPLLCAAAGLVGPVKQNFKQPAKTFVAASLSAGSSRELT